MKLHYSQTQCVPSLWKGVFYYHMKLHYSQTQGKTATTRLKVLLPYEITLLSNREDIGIVVPAVLLPYEITLLSNLLPPIRQKVRVLLPYEITLLSNDFRMLLRGLGFYYHMKLHYSQT